MKKIQVLLKPQCNAEIQNQFATKFGDQCEFTFQGKETEDAIAAAEVVIGEPEEEEILKAENLRWIQLTWAGADKYTKMKAFPTGVTLTNAYNGVQREHNKKLNNGLPILHKVPPKRDYGRYFCIMAEKGGTSHGGLTEKLSPFFHAKKQEVNAYGR